MESVSVVIPAYNAERFLGETLESVLSQTLPPDEIVVVDDGSTDSTSDLVRSFHDRRIRLIVQPNAGTAVACNRGVSAATGRWIAFVDADDVWMPEKLEFQLGACTGYAISHTDSYFIGEGVDQSLRRSDFEPGYSGDVLDRLLVRNFITKSSVVMLRSAFNAAGGFPSKYPAVEDWPLWIAVCAVHPLGYVPAPLLRYRVHRQSKSMAVRRALADHVRIIDDAFSVGGPGYTRRHLRRKALAESFGVNAHFAAQAGDPSFAAYCALRALAANPARQDHWRVLAKAALAPLGVRY